MHDFMNKPEIIPVTEQNIIEAYNNYDDIKHVARIFNISTNEVSNILKQAGIAIRKRRRISRNNELHDVGMTERDFYADKD